MALAALSLPGELQRFMDRALRGELELRVRNLDENARLLYYGGQQILWGMLAAAVGRRWRWCSTGAGSTGRPWAAGHRVRAVRGCSCCSPGWPAARGVRAAAVTSPARRALTPAGRRNI